MGWPFSSPYVKVQCPNGPRFILKDPSKAFSIVAPDWESRVSAVAKALDKVDATVDTTIRKRLTSIVQDLDKNYARLQAHYQAAYLEFAGSPCSPTAEERLNAANAQIRKLAEKLAALEANTEKLIHQLHEPRIEPTSQKQNLSYMLDSSSGSTVFGPMTGETTQDISIETPEILTAEMERAVKEFQI